MQPAFNCEYGTGGRQQGAWEWAAGAVARMHCCTCYGDKVQEALRCLCNVSRPLLSSGGRGQQHQLQAHGIGSFTHGSRLLKGNVGHKQTWTHWLVRTSSTCGNAGSTACS